MENEAKNFLRSLGIMGPLVTLVVWVVNKRWPGLGVTPDLVIWTIDQGAVLVATVLGIWGRWRATKVVTLGGGVP